MLSLRSIEIPVWLRLAEYARSAANLLDTTFLSVLKNESAKQGRCEEGNQEEKTTIIRKPSILIPHQQPLKEPHSMNTNAQIRIKVIQGQYIPAANGTCGCCNKPFDSAPIPS